jgi:hypothetical protein
MNSKHQSILKMGLYVNCLMSLRVSNGKNEYSFIKISEAEPIDITLHMVDIINQQLPEFEAKRHDMYAQHIEPEMVQVEEWIKRHQ